MQLIKCSSSVQSRGRSKPPQPSGKPRVVCVTVQRRSKARGFKATMHICKGVPGQYEVRKSFRLKVITKLEAFNDVGVPLLEVTMSQRGFTGGESKLAFQASSQEARTELLGVLYSFCRSHEKRTPVLVGLRRGDLGEYADLDGDEDEEESSALDADDVESGSPAGPSPAAGAKRGSSRGDDPATPDPRSSLERKLNAAMAQGRDGSSGGLVVVDSDAASSWADRQDAQLGSLLDAVAGGNASLEVVRSRLEAELAALDDANVHELLESDAAAGQVLEGVSATLGCVDDLEETLGMFDAKLRHMREDMSGENDGVILRNEWGTLQSYLLCLAVCTL